MIYLYKLRREYTILPTSELQSFIITIYQLINFWIRSVQALTAWRSLPMGMNRLDAALISGADLGVLLSIVGAFLAYLYIEMYPLLDIEKLSPNIKGEIMVVGIWIGLGCGITMGAIMGAVFG